MTTTITGVEVELHELLDWSHEYEYFVDLLRSKLDLGDDEYDRCVVQQYAIMGVPRPNVVHFDVTYVLEPQ